LLDTAVLCVTASSCLCRPLTDADLHVGAVLPILQRNFKLLEADEYTYQFMENNRHVYRMADAEAAAQAVRQAISQGEPQGITGHWHSLVSCSGLVQLECSMHLECASCMPKTCINARMSIQKLIYGVAATSLSQVHVISVFAYAQAQERGSGLGSRERPPRTVGS
jgi:hypothetical protein